MEILPTISRSIATTSIVEMPYATKLLADELQTYLNMGIRILTGNSVTSLKEPADLIPLGDVAAALQKPLPEVIIPETRIPEYREKPEPVVVSEEALFAMGVVPEVQPEEVDAAADAAAEAAETGTAPVVTAPVVTAPVVTVPVQAPVVSVPAPMVVAAPAPVPALPEELEPAPEQRQVDFNAGMAAARAQMGGFMAPIVYQAPAPGAPQTIVIDTSQEMTDPPHLGGARRHTTPRSRAGSPRRISSIGDQPLTPTSKITVNKLG
jgi:hypothetical protein